MIVTNGAAPDSSFFDALGTLAVPARAIGDCRELKKVEGAMLDAARAAIEL